MTFQVTPEEFLSLVFFEFHDGFTVPSRSRSPSPMPTPQHIDSSLSSISLVFSQFPDEFTIPSPSPSPSPQPPTTTESGPTFGRFECMGCFKTFGNLHSLKRHASAHSYLRPFKCEIRGCKSQFKRIWDRKRHTLKCHENK
jgi:hypothetical protein